MIPSFQGTLEKEALEEEADRILKKLEEQSHERRCRKLHVDLTSKLDQVMSYQDGSKSRRSPRMFFVDNNQYKFNKLPTRRHKPQIGLGSTGIHSLRNWLLSLSEGRVLADVEDKALFDLSQTLRRFVNHQTDEADDARQQQEELEAYLGSMKRIVQDSCGEYVSRLCAEVQQQLVQPLFDKEPEYRDKGLALRLRRMKINPWARSKYISNNGRPPKTQKSKIREMNWNEEMMLVMGQDVERPLNLFVNLGKEPLICSTRGISLEPLPRLVANAVKSATTPIMNIHFAGLAEVDMAVLKETIQEEVRMVSTKMGRRLDSLAHRFTKIRTFTRFISGEGSFVYQHMERYYAMAGNVRHKTAKSVGERRMNDVESGVTTFWAAFNQMIAEKSEAAMQDFAAGLNSEFELFCRKLDGILSSFASSVIRRDRASDSDCILVTNPERQKEEEEAQKEKEKRMRIRLKLKGYIEEYLKELQMLREGPLQKCVKMQTVMAGSDLHEDFEARRSLYGPLGHVQL